jgi:mRNA interferase MazF
MNTCKRGEIWMVNFSPGRGSEQTGARPALVIQNDIGNRHAATTIVAAVTTTIKKYPVTVVIPRGEGGLKETSMVNLAQILTIDKNRLMKSIGFLDKERMREIEDAIKVSLGIP